ncbi:hypothetical protein BGZ98_003647, partial [Dissophora globulifera]
MYDEGGLGLLGPQKHGIRSRRLSVRKQQLYRRDDLASSDLLDSKSHLYHHSHQSHYHQHHFNTKHADSLWSMASTSSSVSSMSLSSSASPLYTHTRPRSMKDMAGNGHSSSASLTSSKQHRRLDASAGNATDEMGSRSRSAGGLVSSLAPHASSLSSSCQQVVVPKWPAPLPPAMQRLNMPGSPLSPFESQGLQTPLNAYDCAYDEEYSFPQRPSRSTTHYFGGARATAVGGGRVGVHTGQEATATGARHDYDYDDDDEPMEEQSSSQSQGSRPMPTSYTFRRRNAIVEGSEDAPKANVFSDLS